MHVKIELMFHTLSDMSEATMCPGDRAFETSSTSSGSLDPAAKQKRRPCNRGCVADGAER